MTDPKPKTRTALRTPKPKKSLGLSVPPALRLPHDDLIAAPGAHSTPGESPTAGNSPTVGISTPVEIPTVGISDGSTVEFPTVGNSPTVGEFPTVRISVEAKAGELRIPNYIVFNLYPMLELDERAVYQELYLWTHGFNRESCRLSQKKLCQTLRLTDKTLARILASLRAKGLLEIGDSCHSGPRDERGTLFRVHLPEVRRATGESPTVGKFPTVGDSPNMKRERKTKRENAPVAAAPAQTPLDKFEIRKKAARLWEIHRHDPLYTHDRLVADVRSALIADGHEIDENLISEATERMGA